MQLSASITLPRKLVRLSEITLHAVDAEEAKRIQCQIPNDDDLWASDYPFSGDLVALTRHLEEFEKFGDQRPYGYYRITRLLDQEAIGGIGFFGPPQNGVVEVGYGLVPSARGHGYAAQALEMIVTIARDLGVLGISADTTQDNIASQRTLEHVGFQQFAFSDDRLHYELSLHQ